MKDQLQVTQTLKPLFQNSGQLEYDNIKLTSPKLTKIFITGLSGNVYEYADILCT